MNVAELPVVAAIGLGVLTSVSPCPMASHAAAISGMRVVVGAFFDDTGANDAGSAYVYDLGGDTPAVPVATLHNPSPAAQDSFGRSVAIDGTIILIGTSEDDTVAIDNLLKPKLPRASIAVTTA